MLERIERGFELALAEIQDGEIQQQADVVRREDQRLVVLVDGGIGVALAGQKLRSRIVSGGKLRDGNRRAAAGVRVEGGQIGVIDSIVVNREVRHVFIAANGLDRGRGDRRLGIAFAADEYVKSS